MNAARVRFHRLAPFRYRRPTKKDRIVVQEPVLA
jgi:hypothetical protein